MTKQPADAAQRIGPSPAAAWQLHPAAAAAELGQPYGKTRGDGRTRVAAMMPGAISERVAVDPPWAEARRR